MSVIERREFERRPIDLFSYLAAGLALCAVGTTFLLQGLAGAGWLALASLVVGIGDLVQFVLAVTRPYLRVTNEGVTGFTTLLHRPRVRWEEVLHASLSTGFLGERVVLQASRGKDVKLYLRPLNGRDKQALVALVERMVPEWKTPRPDHPPEPG